MPQVLEAYRQADLFVLASKVAKDGDRDGLPNVLIEALSQRLACVATNVSGIPELIEDGATGLLTPSDPVALAQALACLISNPAMRTTLGAAGERHVRIAFDMESGIDALAQRFGLPSAGTRREKRVLSCPPARPIPVLSLTDAWES